MQRNHRKRPVVCMFPARSLQLGRMRKLLPAADAAHLLCSHGSWRLRLQDCRLSFSPTSASQGCFDQLYKPRRGSIIVPSGASDKIGTVQRRLAWPCARMTRTIREMVKENSRFRALVPSFLHTCLQTFLFCPRLFRFLTDRSFNFSVSLLAQPQRCAKV